MLHLPIIAKSHLTLGAFMKEFKMYINGQWKNGSKTANSVNPANGSLYATVHQANNKDVDDAINAAYLAKDAWAALPSSAREEMLLKAADWMGANIPLVAQNLMEESGSAFKKAYFEASFAVDVLRTAAGEARRVFGEFQQQNDSEISLIKHMPLGIIVGISPFNFPLILSLKKVAFALAAGNTFILKPASATAGAGVSIALALEAAGLPNGVFNLIFGSGEELSNQLIDDKRTKMITFTGSTEVGRKIAIRAAGIFKKYSLEMGGKNPLIVLKDFDIEQAAKIAAFGAFFHQGQICMCTSRIIVEEEIYDAFCEKFLEIAQSLKVGDPTNESTIIGPLINTKQCDFIDSQIDEAKKDGAKVLIGAKSNGTFYEATILGDVTSKMRIFHEESFGPVTSIIKAKDAQEALELCNDNSYGLSSALLTNNINQAIELALKMEAGMVHINNSTVMDSSTVAFGGTKNSGIGREGGKYSILEFTEPKWISIQYKPAMFPL